MRVSPIEGQYRNLMTRLGLTMLVFEALYTIFGVIIGILPFVTDRLMNPIAGDVIYELLYGLLYAAIFVLPVVFFHLISGGKRQEPMELELRLPRSTILYIFAGMAVINAAAYLNSYLVSIFNYSAFTEQLMETHSAVTNYQLILMVFTTAVVPAFVEEFLFRGLILSNLAPYGRTTAVVASALLFGLMHQNAGQLLYATAAGVVLGLLYLKAKSIWPCVLLHFVNNFVSVIQTALLQRLGEETGNGIVGVMQGLILGVGLLCAIVLILREKRERPSVFATGCFEKDLPADPEYVAAELSFGRRVRLFFSAPMIIFLVICTVQMAGLILMALLL